MREEELAFVETAKDRSANILQQASWANRSWALTVGSILGQIQNPECMKQLRFDPTTRGRATVFVKLLMSTAAGRSWSMLSWSEIPPLSWASLLSNDETVRAETLTRMAAVCETVELALNASADTCHDFEAGGNKKEIQSNSRLESILS